jgi:outer membrane protein X
MTVDFLDIRYNILDNLNAGVKFGFGFNVRDINLINSSTATATMHANLNSMIVGDYYFHNGSSAFAPFVGAGIGSFSVLDINLQFDPNQYINYNYTDLPTVPKVIGGAIRGGFELGRLRLAMEYNMIPRTVMFDAANIMQTVGTSNNSYLTVNLGFVLGGGKWRR